MIIEEFWRIEMEPIEVTLAKNIYERVVKLLQEGVVSVSMPDLVTITKRGGILKQRSLIPNEKYGMLAKFDDNHPAPHIALSVIRGERKDVVSFLYRGVPLPETEAATA